MYIRKEETASDWNSYLKPFDEKLWLASLYWILTSSTVTILIGCISSRILNSKVMVIEEALIPFTALSNQGECVNTAQSVLNPNSGSNGFRFTLHCYLNYREELIVQI